MNNKHNDSEKNALHDESQAPASTLANDKQLLGFLRSATLDELQAIDGISVVVAESIVAWFSDADNIALLIWISYRAEKKRCIYYRHKG